VGADTARRNDTVGIFVLCVPQIVLVKPVKPAPAEWHRHSCPCRLFVYQSSPYR
jgi:hypothetical protein